MQLVGDATTRSDYTKSWIFQRRKMMSKDSSRKAMKISDNAVQAIAGAMNPLLADFFALYVKTKNFHWHVSGPHFHDYHLLFDDQASQVLAATDGIAERVRKLGGTTLRSIGHISRLQNLSDNDAESVDAEAMLAELLADNRELAATMREVHELVEEHGDVATASLLENWIDEAELRAWFLREVLGQN
jgi:starvation-inducible DNA-binding protein